MLSILKHGCHALAIMLEDDVFQSLVPSDVQTLAQESAKLRSAQSVEIRNLRRVHYLASFAIEERQCIKGLCGGIRVNLRGLKLRDGRLGNQGLQDGNSPMKSHIPVPFAGRENCSLLLEYNYRYTGLLVGQPGPPQWQAMAGVKHTFFSPWAIASPVHPEQSQHDLLCSDAVQSSMEV
jgi:hypothetical protein